MARDAVRLQRPEEGVAVVWVRGAESGWSQRLCWHLLHSQRPEHPCHDPHHSRLSYRSHPWNFPLWIRLSGDRICGDFSTLPLSVRWAGSVGNATGML